MTHRLSSFLALPAIASLALCGCAAVADKAPPPSSKVKASSVALEDGKQMLLVASALRDQAIFFTRPPYDLNGAWRTEATCGIFDPRALEASTGTVFGLEADRREAGPRPTQFYGVYARHFATPQPGLQVFASSHAGNHGQVFLAGATVVDLALETDGVNVTYLARDAETSGAYAALATVPLASPGAPHQAGFGMFQAGSGAKIGFTSFRVPQNGTPTTPPPAAQDAMNACYQAALLVLEAVYAVDGPVVGAAEVAAADGLLAQATAALATAKQRVEGLPDPGDGDSPGGRALAAIGKAERELAKADAGFAKKGAKASKPFLKAVSKRLFAAALQVTDALIPDELRVALPGGRVW